MRVPLLLLAASLALAAQVDVAAAAARIDALVDADLVARKLAPEPACDDAAFVRRAWLDLGGRIPTAAEAEAFLADRDPGKRAKLIRRITATPAWAMAEYTWIADILRVQSRLQDRTPGQAWIDWLWAAVAADKPWDALTREQLTATGDIFADGGGATGFTMRDAGMPLDHAAITAQTFLGTRIGCAQCHDHPFDTWTRLDFLRFAAFSADAKTQLGKGGLKGMQSYKELRKELDTASPQVRNTTRAIATIVGAHVGPPNKTWLPVPDDYQYQDAKKGDHVQAAALFAPAAEVPAKGDARQALVAWMTSPDNPRFALAIGNRLWKRLFGTGLVEPVDDLRGDPDKPAPPLQAALAQLVRDCGYDLKEVEVVLCSTRHWQRRQWTGDLPAGGGVTPGRPALRLPATAWWDSLVTLAVADPDTRVGLDAKPLVRMHDQLQDADGKGLIAMAERLIDAFKAGPRRAAAKDPEMAEVVAVLRAAPKQKAAAKKPQNPAAANRMRARPPRDAVLRAANLTQPAPAGHPLRTLGESDRELIDNASDQPTTPQALLLMNGVVDEDILIPGSRLMQELDDLHGAAAIDHLWLAVLSRHPSAAERSRAEAAIAAHPDTGLADVAWALVNGDEFRITP